MAFHQAVVGAGSHHPEVVADNRHQAAVAGESHQGAGCTTWIPPMTGYGPRECGSDCSVARTLRIPGIAGS